jgi:methyl-accepting chemotaxis protein
MNTSRTRPSGLLARLFTPRPTEAELEQERRAADALAQVAALNRTQAVAEFALDGTLLTANANFLALLGYSEGEVRGQHHRLFVDPAAASGAEYRTFWSRLAAGEPDAGEYRRIAKGGRAVWLQASYSPVPGEDGRPAKVVKYATDITARKLQQADSAGQVAAIGKAQAVIEFALDGTVLTANDHFLNALGYTLGEVKGQHHSLFVEPAGVADPAYRAFWAKLGRGEYDAGEYKRIGKGGCEVWIRATYNPIFDMDGKPFKVVKYATDVTAEKLRNADFEGQIAAIGKSQAVIEFALDGTVLGANDQFLAALGYTLAEIKGRHHSLFVAPAEAASPEYREFWSRLGRGEFDAGEYRRIAKGGREVWIQASYNPILGLDGKPAKVVKYATDITAQKLRNADYAGQIAAIGKAQAVIEFGLDGTCSTPTRISCRRSATRWPRSRASTTGCSSTRRRPRDAEYRAFWDKLARGEYDAGEYKRIGKGGREVWIQASYNPIHDMNGKPFKVVKYATDVTAQKLRNADFEGQIAAIGKAQGVIEFTLDGRILTANDAFLRGMGYQLADVKGQHHSQFVDPATAAGVEYRNFWTKLGRGEYDAGRYRRVDRHGNEVWVQASYNPILDMSGKPFKVVKYASFITDEVKAERMLTAAVEQARAATNAAMRGDLTQRIPLEGKTGPVAELCGGVNNLIEGTAVIFEDIGRVFEGLSHGDLAQRIPLDGKHGSIAELCTGVNGLMGNTAEILEDFGRVFAALASGDLTQRVTRDAQGMFDRLKQDANASCEKLTAVIEEVRRGDDRVDRHDVRVDHAEQRQREGDRQHGDQGRRRKPATAARR